uniref:General secretion pathway protein H n=1 Tax=Dechloromonas aromatica (strain RCB) TaxID=159087 RepID=Q47BL0_DECAR
MRLQKGFTLIELMIVVAIIAILASIAMPAYQDYVIRGRIADATSILSSKRVRIEQYFQDNRTYVGAPDCAADAATSQNFSFSCTVEEPGAFTLTAVGAGQVADFSYSINQNGQRWSEISGQGWVGNATCWATRRGGAC